MKAGLHDGNSINDSSIDRDGYEKLLPGSYFCVSQLLVYLPTLQVKSFSFVLVSTVGRANLLLSLRVKRSAIGSYSNNISLTNPISISLGPQNSASVRLVPYRLLPFPSMRSSWKWDDFSFFLLFFVRRTLMTNRIRFTDWPNCLMRYGLLPVAPAAWAETPAYSHQAFLVLCHLACSSSAFYSSFKFCTDGRKMFSCQSQLKEQRWLITLKISVTSGRREIKIELNADGGKSIVASSQLISNLLNI